MRGQHDDAAFLVQERERERADTVRILVTGAAGFVGNHLVNALAADSDVWALARTHAPMARTSVTWVLHDFTAQSPFRGLPERIDVVVHLAQSSHFRDFPEHAADVFEVNVDGTFRLLEYARLARARYFIFASTGGLYGVGPRPFRETDPPSFEGRLKFYFASKYAGETLVRGYSSHYFTTILRPFFLYGSGQHESMLLPRLIGRIARGDPVTVQGTNGGPRINPVHVSDVVVAIRNCLSLDGNQIINVAGTETVSIQELALRIGACLNKPPRYERGEERTAGNVMGDISRMQKLVGTPHMSLDKGLGELCKAFGGLAHCP